MKSLIFSDVCAVEAKVSKGKHRKNKQEKEESEFESSLETKEQLGTVNKHT